MNITLDIILLAVLVISFVIGYKKGFVKSVWKIVALVVTIVLVLALKTPTVNFLAGSALANNISTKIAENVNIPQGGGVDIAETLNLPEFIQSDMTNQIDSTNNAVNSINEKNRNVAYKSLLDGYRLRGTVYHNTSYTYGGVYDNKRYYGSTDYKRCK